MGQASTDTRAGFGAGNARGALLGAAALVVLAVVVALVAAGVTSGEVAATVLFLPVFAAGLLGGRVPGFVAAAGATVVYVALRRGDMADAGVASSGVLTLARAAAYAVAAHVGALAQAWVPAAAPGAGAGARPLGPEPLHAGSSRTVAPPYHPPEWAEVVTAPRPMTERQWAERAQPVLVGAGARVNGYPYAVDGDDPRTATMSGGWPPAEPGRDPSRDPWSEADATRHHLGDDLAHTGGWAGGVPPSGPPTGDVRSAADDSWETVQRVWSEQRGLPEDDPPDDGAWGAPAPGPPPADPWGQPPGDAWGQPVPPPPATDAWGQPAPAPPPAGDGWDAGPATDAWGRPVGGAAGTWRDPAPAGWQEPPLVAPWPDPAVPAGPWAPDGGWPTTGPNPAVWDDPAAVPVPEPPPRHVALPAVDAETGLWTAKFLRDRLSSERARSRRSGRPFSLVLVQVPDGPLAQLPYRRQVTLLRELGYQLVAGGIVDHLVHVPDQAQHWFAVILPDTDRSGAQVLERRLRLGIGGYLSSRGLRLRDLESASLTAPDDDPAMGDIWEALIGPDEAGSSPMAYDY
jgi:hypothetical protein